MTLAFEDRQFDEGFGGFAGIDVESGAGGVLENVRDIAAIQVLPPPIDVTPTGTTPTLSWRVVHGATGVRIDSSTVTVAPEVSGMRNLGIVASGKKKVGSITVTSPAPGALIRALRIPDLERHDGQETIEIKFGNLAGFRLVLTPIVGGQDQAPIVAVPALERQRALPAQLTGGALSGWLLSLPDVVGDKFKVTLVDGDAPEDFVAQTISHGDVRMYAAPSPVGLHIDGPDGAEVAALAGPIVARTVTDVSAALKRHLDTVVGNGAPTATITVRSDVVGSASVLWTTSGRIERKFNTRFSVDTTGSAASISVPDPKPGRAPSATLADVTVTHHGMALHPLSDDLPTTDAGLGGPRVRDVAVVRELPSDALRDQYIARLGVIGWPYGETDLSLEVLGTTATVAGLVAPVDRDPAMLVWFEFDQPLLVDRRVSVALTATRGAFGWIADPEPLLRIAVTTTPAGERVLVGGRAILLTGDETVTMGFALSGTDAWTVDTDQFCTVSIANAMMEFAP